MNREENNNAATSATTSPNGPRKPTPESARQEHARNVWLAEKELGQSEFLARQVKDAKAALSAALSDAAKSFGRGLDPAPITKKHPWLGVAGAAGVGFAAALAMDHLKESRRRHAEERRLHPPVPTNGHAYAPPPAAGGGIMGRVMSELINAIKPALLAFVTAQMTGKAHEEGEKSEAAENAAAQGASATSYNAPRPTTGFTTPPPT